MTELHVNLIQEGLRFVSSAFWPFVTLVVILRFKEPIIQLLDRVIKIKTGGFELELNRAKTRYISNMLKNTLLESPRLKTALPPEELDHIMEDINRKVATTISLNEQEARITEYLSSAQDNRANANDICISLGWKFNQCGPLFRALQQKGIISVTKEEGRQMVQLNTKL